MLASPRQLILPRRLFLAPFRARNAQARARQATSSFAESGTGFLRLVIIAFHPVALFLHNLDAL